MRIRGPLVCLAAALLGFMAAAPAKAQSTKRGVHQMVINNGSMQTVRFFPNRLSPGEGAALRDLERNQNELAFVRSVQDLRRQYIRDEKIRQNQRTLAQQAAYGDFISASSFGGYGTLGNVSVGFGNPLWLSGYGGYRDIYGLGGYYGLGNIGYGYGGFGGGAGVGGSLGAENAATAAMDLNLTDERTVKNALVSVLPQQATAQYAASIDRAFDSALARASSSPTIRLALGLPDGRRARDYTLPTPAAVAERHSRYSVTTKDGSTYHGDKMEESKDWVTIFTKDGGKVRVRPADVTRIEEGKPGGVVPAAD